MDPPFRLGLSGRGLEGRGNPLDQAGPLRDPRPMPSCPAPTHGSGVLPRCDGGVRRGGAGGGRLRGRQRPGPVRRRVAHRGGFAAYVEQSLREAHEPRQPGFVCQTVFWWTEGTEYVGSHLGASRAHRLPARGRRSHRVRRTPQPPTGGSRDPDARGGPAGGREAGDPTGPGDLRRRQRRLAHGDRGQRGSAGGPSGREAALLCLAQQQRDNDDLLVPFGDETVNGLVEAGLGRSRNAVSTRRSGRMHATSSVRALMVAAERGSRLPCARAMSAGAVMMCASFR